VAGYCSVLRFSRDDHQFCGWYLFYLFILFTRQRHPSLRDMLEQYGELECAGPYSSADTYRSLAIHNLPQADPKNGGQQLLVLPGPGSYDAFSRAASLLG
jgi:hypothetical protein